MKKRKSRGNIRDRSAEADLIAGAGVTAGVDSTAGAGMIAGVGRNEGPEKIAEKRRNEGQRFISYVIEQPIPGEKEPT